MQLQGLNNLNLGTDDGSLFNVSRSMVIRKIPTLSIDSLGGGSMSSIPSVPSLACDDPTGAPAGGPLTTMKLESSIQQPSPPNLFTKNAAQAFLQPENEANNNNNNNGKHKLNNGGLMDKNKLSNDTRNIAKNGTFIHEYGKFCETTLVVVMFLSIENTQK